MRASRITADGKGYYHCISRVVDRQMILGDVEREKFRELMRGVETFSGVRVLTYAILSNHFHILAEVPAKRELGEAEIVERLAAMYDRREVVAILDQWALWRTHGLDTRVQEEQDRLRVRMCDAGSFVKTVKQRFTQWYNRRKGRTGTLWEDRFKSVMIEPPSHALRERQSVGALATIAAYIDLNAVRAGIVSDPRDYAWCGYGEAVAGGKRAREGLALIFGEAHAGCWRTVASRYRHLIDAAGPESGRTTGGAALPPTLTVKQVQQIVKQRGELPLRDVLRCRVRYFSDGLAIGSKAFVNEVFQQHRDNFGPKRKDGARPLRFADWGGLCAARDLRLKPIAAPGG